MVFLRVQPKHNSLSLGKYKKLSARYCGPYLITKKINDQSYELSLPPHIKIHNVFYINIPKKYVPDENHILGDELPLVTKEGTLDITLERILQSKECILRNKSIMEHLIKWTGYPKQDAS